MIFSTEIVLRVNYKDLKNLSNITSGSKFMFNLPNPILAAVGPYFSRPLYTKNTIEVFKFNDWGQLFRVTFFYQK